MEYLMSAGTPGGQRRFVVRNGSPNGAMLAFRNRISLRQPVTDQDGGIYGPDEIDTDTLTILSGAIPAIRLTREFRYFFDGERTEGAKRRSGG